MLLRSSKCDWVKAHHHERKKCVHKIECKNLEKRMLFVRGMVRINGFYVQEVRNKSIIQPSKCTCNPPNGRLRELARRRHEDSEHAL